MAGTVYWVGADNNIYAKGPSFSGVQNLGGYGGTKNTGVVVNHPNGTSTILNGTQFIADPNPPKSSATNTTRNTAPTNNTSGNGAGAAASAPIDYAQLAQYDQSIGNLNSAVNRLGAQQASGNSTIDASYQNAINQLLLGKNQANTEYTGNKTQTSKDYIQAKNTIGANAGNSLNGLLRLLGSKGAGGSSAYNISAPGAVAREATQQRTGATDTYGANNQSLDTNWNNYLTGYNNQVSSANNQRDQQHTDLQNQIASSHASLLQQLATLAGQRAQAAHGNATGAAQPYINQANTLLDQTANYHTNPISFQTQAYTAPSLASYTTSPNAAPTVQGQAPTNDYTSPYLAALLKQKPVAAAPAASPTGG